MSISTDASPAVRVGLSAVVLAVTEGMPRILCVPRPSGAEAPGRRAPGPGPGATLWALPSGPLDVVADATLELGLRRLVREQTGLGLGYVEQLYTFGDRGRDPDRMRRGVRDLSVAYLALTREVDGEGTSWQDAYSFLPWEDWRRGCPPVVAEAIQPAVRAWVAAASGAALRGRRERAEVTFGLGGAAWDGERVLERYELLYEIGLLAEKREGEAPGGLGAPMALDHRRILATALGRVRGKIKYRPVVFELVPDRFTLLALQHVVEALAGIRLHKGNFRRLVDRGGLVEGTGARDPGTGGRPAELFRFRRDVLRERRAPGVGLPGA
ncbi:MAG: hypothetical protein ACE5EL_05555 [Anaerolineae bacterium]